MKVTNLFLVIFFFRSNDPDGASDKSTFFIKAGNDDGFFILDETNGMLKVADSTLLTFLGNDVPQRLTVKVEDSGGLATQVDVLVSVLDANEAPMLPVLSVRYISEKARNGDYVGTELKVNDPDNGDTHMWSILGTTSNANGDIFSFLDRTGQLVVSGVNGVNQLDYEYEPEHVLTILVEDSGIPSLNIEGQVQIYILDENEPPIFDEGADVDLYLQERDSSGTPVTANTKIGAPLRAVDPDMDQSVKYSLSQINLAANNQCPCLDSSTPCHRGSETIADWRSSLDQIGWSSCAHGYGLSAITRGETGNGLDAITEATCTAGIDMGSCVEVDWTPGPGWNTCPTNGDYVLTSIYRSTTSNTNGGFADINKATCCRLRTGLTFSTCQAILGSSLPSQGSVARCSEGSMIQALQVSNTGLDAITSQPLTSLSGFRCCTLSGGLSDLTPFLAEQGSSCTAKIDMFGRADTSLAAAAVGTTLDYTCPLGTTDCFASTSDGSSSKTGSFTKTEINNAQWDLVFRQTQTDVCNIPTMETAHVLSSGSYDTGSELKYKGRDHSVHSSNSFNMVVLDIKTEMGGNQWDGFVASTDSYATGTGGNVAEVYRMMNDIAALRSGVVVMLACEGECVTFTSQVSGFEQSLQSLGSGSFNVQDISQSFALIGQKGAGNGRAIQHAIKKGTTKTGFGKLQKGYCVKKFGRDENDLVTKLYGGNVQTDDEVQACWEKCAAVSGVTGCEAIWNQGNRGCYVHKSTAIIRGNGVNQHYCALYNNKVMDASQVSFSCKSHKHVDIQNLMSENVFSSGEWNRNSHDATSANYAILSQLENFRNQGTFLFKLVYPRVEVEYSRTNIQDTFSSVEMIWSQTSNPQSSAQGSTVTGYTAYKVQDEFSNTCGWHGLIQSTVADTSLLTGSTGNSYFDIGATSIKNNMLNGPCKSGYLVSQVELYVARPNYQQLAGGLTLQTSSADQIFRIDSESGQIYTTGLGSIDHESVPLYNLIVSVHDDGSKFHGGVVNTTKTGAVCMFWEDSISTEYNTAKYSTLLSGHNFCRNPNGDQPYSWCFRTSDGNAESCVTTSQNTMADISVRISIVDVNDPPLALFKDAVFYVNENTNGGDTIGTLTATDPDKNQILQFTLNTGTSSSSIPFDVDSLTGEVRVTNILDYETKSEYRLSVTVRDAATGSGLSDIGYFTVRLIDINEPPVILTNQKRSINENSPIGSNVGTEIIAMDTDQSGSLSFSIQSGNELGLFAIRSCDGQITVQNSKLLDYEALAKKINIPLNVRVSDTTFFSDAIVLIDVIDMPEAPVFDEPQQYLFTVLENAALDDVVGTVRATQPDGTALSYSLIDTKTGGLFSLDSTTGVLSLSASKTGKTLDYETNQIISLQVVATDDTSKMTTTVRVTIRVGDVNEVPIATNDMKYYIDEDSEGSKKVSWYSRFASPILNGYDVDEGQTVKFSIVAGHGDSIFQTTTNGNRIFLKPGVIINYESNRKYNIQILVTDSSASNPLTTQVSAIVHVVDINEAPTLANAYAVVPENTARGTAIGTPMVATDPDTIFQTTPFYGQWEKLTSKSSTVSTDVGKSSFDIQFAASETKILRRVCKYCGKEHKDVYYRRLTAFPSGTSIYDLLHTTWLSAGNTRGIDFQLYSNYKDAIAATNAWSFCNYNDNGIGFPRDCGPNKLISHQWQSATRGGQREWTWFVDTSTLVESQSGLNQNVCDNAQCSKTDPLTFSILSGNYKETFTFLRANSDMYTRLYVGKAPICIGIGGTLTSSYSDMKKLCSTEPTCTGFTFTSQSSPEDTTSGTGALRSCMINGKEVEFGGQETSGTFDYWKKETAVQGQLIVSDNIVLDRETKKRFKLRVQVSDSGLGGSGRNVLSAAADYIVDIQNVNESPYFVGCDDSVVQFEIKEHGQGTTCNSNSNNRKVGTLRAKDHDTTWGDVLTMAITPVGSPFSINEHGVIRTSDSNCKIIDYEKTDSWNIIVTVTDVAGLKASCNVKINVVDINEHPILTRKSTSVSNSLAVNALFGKPVVAVDVDSDQVHDYYVVGGNGRNFIDIEKNTGRLFVKSDMSSLVAAKKQILVRVHDNGNGKLMAQNWVDVDIVNNNQAPTMASSFLRSFPENSKHRALIGTQIIATDPDGENTKIKYHKISGDINNCFSIDNYGGQIRLRNAALTKECNDYESRFGKPWVVGITAIDSGAGALTASTLVNIVVTDVNESPTPSNIQSSKHFYVYESELVGSEIASGSFALDQDSGSSLSYTISRVAPQSGVSMFGIQNDNALSNIISLKSYSAELESSTEFVSVGTSSLNLEIYSNLHLMWSRSSFKEITGLSNDNADETYVSYESVRYTGHYLSHDGSTLHLKKQTTDIDFDPSATFIKRTALFSTGNDLHVSLECANKLNSYLSRDKYTGKIRVVNINQGADDVFNKAATWFRSPGLALHGNFGSIVLKRSLDYDKGPRKFRLILTATDTGETGCQNIVKNYQTTGTSVGSIAATTNVWQCCAECGSNVNCLSFAYNKDISTCELFSEVLVRPSCFPSCLSSSTYDSGSKLPIEPFVNKLFTQTVVTIHVLDVNEPPEGASKEFYLKEDAKAGTIVGTVKGKDPDAKQTVKYGIKRENCFEVNAGTTKKYQLLPPTFPGKRSATAHIRVKAAGSVHMLLSRSSTAVEVTFAGGAQRQHEIKYCKKYVAFPIPTVDQCSTFATSIDNAFALSAELYEELWVHVDEETHTVTAGYGPDPGAFGATILTANINATIVPTKYSVSTGYGNVGHFAGVCLPVISEQDIGVFAIDSISGVIRVRKPILDYEVRAAYGLEVLLYDQGATAIPPMTSSSFVRVNIKDVNEPPEFSGAAQGIEKKTSLIGCFFDKSTAVTPRLTPDPLRDLSTMPSTSGVQQRDVLVGNHAARNPTKIIRSPGVLSCNNKAINPQNPWWKDRFRVQVDSAAGTITVTRLDKQHGWGQQLVLRCTASELFSSGATKITCDAACAKFQYFGLQGQGECWCGNSYGKYGSVPGQCNIDGPFYGRSKNVIYQRGDESISKVMTRTVRIYTKGTNGEVCGLRAAPTPAVPINTVGSTGHLAMWDCSTKSDAIEVSGKTFSTTIDGVSCKLRHSVLPEADGMQAAFFDCSANAMGSEMTFSSAAIVSASANLAKGRPTTQSSEGWGGKSNRAVDGNSSPRYGDRSCTHTKTENNAWWRVDLERNVDVSRIEIVNRKDCCSKRIKNTKVYVGTTSVMSEATECGDVAYSSTNPIVVKCKSNINGRYVWVKKTKRDALTLCEVEVFASSSATISPAPLASSPFIYVSDVEIPNSDKMVTCGLRRHKHEGVPASILFGNQFPALFDCTGTADAIQIGDEIPITSELYYDDHNSDGSVKTEGWRSGVGSNSVVGASSAVKTLTYGSTTTAATTCSGQNNAQCRQMHGPFASDTTREISKEWKGLPKHTGLRVQARVWSVGSWDNENIQIQTSSKALSEIKPMYKYIGCYKDRRNRDLKKRFGSRYHDHSYCLAKCQGYKYFALQYKGECWCGNSYGKYGKHRSHGKCTMEGRSGGNHNGGCGNCRGGPWGKRRFV